jgi:HSP20 family protein
MNRRGKEMAIQVRQPSRIMNPWRSDFWEDMERRNEDLFGRPLVPMARHYPVDRWWIPEVDVYEKDGMFVLKTDLPGMKGMDVDIFVEDGVLTIKGEREAESEVKEGDYYQCERTYGNFSRSINLPSNVDAGKIEASFEDGVLEIHLPKTPEAKPKKVKVSAKKK